MPKSSCFKTNQDGGDGGKQPPGFSIALVHSLLCSFSTSFGFLDYSFSVPECAVFVCTPCMFGVLRGYKGIPDPLELELQGVISGHAVQEHQVL